MFDDPVFYRTEAEAKAALAEWVAVFKRVRFRVVSLPGFVAIEPLDLEEFALPLIVRYMRLHGTKDRGGRCQPVLDRKRGNVGHDWASLSGWEKRAIYYAPEVPLAGLRRRFPFARPSTVEGVVRLLTLHELAHYAMAHNGLSESLGHRGPREALAERFDAMEREADVLTALWWREGLTPETVTTAAARSARAAA